MSEYWLSKKKYFCNLNTATYTLPTMCPHDSSMKMASNTREVLSGSSEGFTSPARNRRRIWRRRNGR